MKIFQHFLLVLASRLQTRSITIIEEKEYSMVEAAESAELPDYIRDSARRRLAELYVYN